MSSVLALVRKRKQPLGLAEGDSGARVHRRSRVYPFLLLALAFLVFQHGLKHQFTNWDDSQYIVNNSLIRGLSPGRIWAAFTSFQLFNYNPLHIISYMLDYELWGLSPAGFFFDGLLLHLLGGVLFYFFSLRFLGSPDGAFLVAAVFLVHPTRVESVAWLSERKDVLSGSLGAASLLLYLSYLDGGCSRGRRLLLLGGVWLAFLLALLSKSQLVTLPFLYLAIDLQKRRPLCTAFREKTPFLVLSVLFSTVTLCAHSGGASQGVKFPESILVPVAAMPRYLWHLLFPVNLSPYYDYAPGAFHGALPVIMGLLVLSFLACAACLSYRRDRVWLLGIVWFLASLAPVSGVFRINVLLADRYLYLALLGPLLALARSLLSFPALRRGLPWVFLPIVAALSWITAGYVPVFADSQSLWTRVLEVSPGSSLGHSSLGHYYLGQGRLAEAACHYDADLCERPYYESSILGRALIHEEAGEKDDARRLYLLALEKRPDSAQARIQYADFLERVGEPEKGLEALLGMDGKKANGEVYQKLFDLYRRLGRRGEELASARRAVDLSPFDPGSWLRLALAWEDQGEAALALQAARRAAAMAPGSGLGEEIIDRILSRLRQD